MDKDPIIEYMKENDIPVTRDNYIGLNWLGDYDPSEPLPAELEADLPEELQIHDEEEDETE
jgi:hypothetical protein